MAAVISAVVLTACGGNGTEQNAAQGRSRALPAVPRVEQGRRPALPAVPRVEQARRPAVMVILRAVQPSPKIRPEVQL